MTVDACYRDASLYHCRALLVSCHLGSKAQLDDGALELAYPRTRSRHMAGCNCARREGATSSNGVTYTRADMFARSTCQTLSFMSFLSKDDLFSILAKIVYPVWSKGALLCWSSSTVLFIVFDLLR